MFLNKHICFSLRGLIFALSFLSLILGYGAKAGQIILPDQLPECPVNRVTEAILSSDNVLWVIGEQSGIYTFDLKESSCGKWKEVSKGKGFDPSTNYYSIVEDKQGRVWIGTDNQGVIVYNGKDWKGYTIDNALPANRVYDLAVSALTGEVGIATSSGVSIYNPESESWKDFTRGNGLVEDQVRALHFSQDGALWLAYTCGGVTKASTQHPSKLWVHVQASWKWDEKGFVRHPLTPSGRGLPSNLNNGIISSSGTIWVATCAGISYASVKGGSWKYVRGADYLDKNKGNYKTDQSTKWGSQQSGKLLLQDYVSALAPAKQGGLWVGSRDKGICRWTPLGGVLEQLTLPSQYDKYEITTFVNLPDGSLGYGTNGRGFGIVRRGSGKWKEVAKSVKGLKSLPEHPKVIEIEEEGQETNIESLFHSEPVSQGEGVYVGEDWMTKGDWPGRYGNVYTLLCSASERYTTGLIFGQRKKYLTETMYAFLQDYDIERFVGPHRKSEESYECKLFDNNTEARNALLSPNDFKRKEAVWDDGGANYHETWSGPDLWIKIIAPEGNHLLDLYFYNSVNDGEADNLKADYYIEMRKEAHVNDTKQPNEETSDLYIEKLYSLPVLARARAHQISGGGVYQKFAAKGQGTYWFRICRNNSPSAKLNGIFVSKNIPPMKLDPETIRQADSHFNKILPLPPKLEEKSIKSHPEWCELWNRVSEKHTMSPRERSVWRTELLNQYRRQLKNEEGKKLRDLLAWELGIVTQESRLEIDRIMSESKKKKEEQDRRLREQLGIPSPGGNDEK